MTEQTRRSTRLIRIRDLLIKRGPLSTAEIARETGFSQRTIQRDILDLETDLGVPLVTENRKWRIMDGANLVFGPVRLTLQEARALYFAMRLMLRSADERDPDALSALEKVADAIPQGMAGHMRRTVSEYAQLPSDHDAIENLRRITEAWANSRTIRFTYRSAHSSEQRRYEVDPYILDHTQSGTYLIGYSHTHGETRVFKLDRIHAVENAGREFDPVDIDRLAETLRHSWGGVGLGDSRYDVVIDFTPAVAARIQESYWHVSQELEPLADGGIRLKVSLPSLLEITPWVLSWGPEATVVQPAELRDRVAHLLARAAERYNRLD
ncbi:helix-turn-helix transcriptional regulator [Tepidiforma sp.]|uniref:helix-turn-helix transcriptional regulator n=1 Tax=Tepidiforma sp. TaxID=2682230 RepID=UPI002ADDA986|nr:WYL domain-containing protein [Tepidiforma sp.]